MKITCNSAKSSCPVTAADRNLCALSLALLNTPYSHQFSCGTWPQAWCNSHSCRLGFTATRSALKLDFGSHHVLSTTTIKRNDLGLLEKWTSPFFSRHPENRSSRTRNFEVSCGELLSGPRFICTCLFPRCIMRDPVDVAA